MLTERESILALIEKEILRHFNDCNNAIDKEEQLLADVRCNALKAFKRDIERGEHLRQFPVEEKV